MNSAYYIQKTTRIVKMNLKNKPHTIGNNSRQQASVTRQLLVQFTFSGKFELGAKTNHLHSASNTKALVVFQLFELHPEGIMKLECVSGGSCDSAKQ